LKQPDGSTPRLRGLLFQKTVSDRDFQNSRSKLYGSPKIMPGDHLASGWLRDGQRHSDVRDKNYPARLSVRVTLYGRADQKIADRAMISVRRGKRRHFHGMSPPRRGSVIDKDGLDIATCQKPEIIICPGCWAAYEQIMETLSSWEEGRFECTCGFVLARWVVPSSPNS
jgi:hypothetical protein